MALALHSEKYAEAEREAHGGSEACKERREAKAERQRKYMWVFMNGKQVRIKRPPTIEGIDADEYIRQNADLQ